MTQQEFLGGVIDAENHRPLLWLALEATSVSSLPVLEFGAGTGSTDYLRKYCSDTGRRFMSYDSNEEWAAKWKSRYIKNWMDSELYMRSSVVLVDQAPGEYRHQSMIKLKDDTQIIVVHDSEPDESMGYQLDLVWPHFKYRVFIKGTKIWSAAVSNHYDLTKHVGEMIGDFKVEL